MKRVCALLFCLILLASLFPSAHASELAQGNIYNKDTVTVGGLGSNGSVGDNSDFYTTDYERVIEGKTYSGWQEYGALILTNPCVCDEDKNFIQILEYAPGTSNVVVIPEDVGAYYARFSVGTNQATDERRPRIVAGEAAKPWRPYQNEEREAQTTAGTATETTAVVSTNCYAFLPDLIYCAAGATIDLYNHQVCINADRFHIQWICSKGFAEGRRFTVTADAVEDLPLTLNIYDDDNALVYSKDATLRCVSPPLTEGAVKVLAIGDSMTYGGATWQMEIQSALSSGAIEFVGTHTTSFRDATCRHEGYNGISAADFLSSDIHRGEPNPFYNPSTGGFDYRYYLTSTGLNPDAVMIALGTNDMNGAAAEQAPEIAENIV